MIAECVILRRIENLQQRRGRIAAKITPHLIDLVQHEDRIVDAGPADGLNDAAGECPDIGTTMAAQFGFVMDAAETESFELRPIARAIDCPKLVLPTPGGPTRQRIGAFAVGLSFKTARCSTIRSFTSLIP